MSSLLLLFSVPFLFPCRDLGLYKVRIKVMRCNEQLAGIRFHRLTRPVSVCLTYFVVVYDAGVLL